ncbi:MAG: response regulator [Alphaproteobacteria bacterium]|nr:response regulator [Alphaproteobacteria bacterium]|tara:strand:- start:1650 stop:2057 length:408 start_codon:yes stop_codon:yes gene_type:complete
MTQIVLVVDDNQADHFLVKSVIDDQENKVELSHAYDGEEALNMLKEGLIPTVILLDISMPGVDGFEFLKEYSNNSIYAKAPVVMLSSSYEEKDKDLAFSYNMVKDYICKPLKVGDFDRIISAFSKNSENISISFS